MLRSKSVILASVAALSLSLVSDVTAQAAVAATVAQGRDTAGYISLDLNNVPLRQAIDQIAERGDVRVAYGRSVESSALRVTLRESRITVAQALQRVLRGAPLMLTTYEGRLAIVDKKADRLAQGVVAGKVTDAKTGKAVSGAGVSIDNSRSSTTSEDGSYRVTGVPTGNHTITVRIVGYTKQTRQVTVGEGTTVAADFKLEPSANVLDQVVVTGTIVQTELKAVPSAITVVTSKQIEERGITRIDQLFRGDIPGLFSMNLGSNALLDEVTMYSRGATALTAISAGTARNTNPIKTYIDGVEMADSKYLSQIDPSSIERIEILTGPQASTVYGSNAINGVMQIFTKRGHTAKPQVTLNLISGVAQNNFSSHLAPDHVIDGILSGMEGRMSYNVGGSWNYAGAWTPGKQTQRLSGNAGARTEWSKLTTDLSARRGLTRNQQNGGVAQGITDLRTTGVWLPTASVGIANPEASTLNSQTLGLAIGFRPFSRWSHDLVIGSDGSIRGTIRTEPGFSSVSDTLLSISQSNTFRESERYSSTMQLPLSRMAHLNLTVGGDHWRTTGSSWSASPLLLTGNIALVSSLTRSHPAKNIGAFIQGQLGIKDALFLTYGVREDWNPNFGDEAKVRPGRYGVSYTRDIETPIGPLSAKIRGSYGRSIRPPSEGYKLAVRETFSDLTALFGQYDAYLANPDLGPEHQQGGEGGIELYLGSRGSLIVTRYNQTVDNLILFVGGLDSVRSLAPQPLSETNCSSIFRDNNGYCYRYQTQYLNAGSIRNQGWEMQGSVNVGPLTTRGTYSWTKSRILGITPKYRTLLPGQYEPGRPFDYIPEHTWALGVTYDHSQSSISLSVNGIGTRYLFGSFADALSLAISGNSRFTYSRPRAGDVVINNVYHPQGPGYATTDLNAMHRFSSNVDATLQINNLTNYYANDFNAQYVTMGRQSRLGLRIRLR